MNIFKRLKRYVRREDLADRIYDLENTINNKPELIGFKTIEAEDDGWDDTNKVHPIHWENDA